MNANTVSAASAPSRAGWALAVLALCTLLASLGTSSPNVALPALQTAFGAQHGSGGK
jgi:hypothetical protein